MKYNGQVGERIMYKYLSKSGLQERLEHSRCVGDWGFKITTRLKERNNAFIEIDPEFVRFLGYVHDIGYWVGPRWHELMTEFLLTRLEKVPKNIARMTMHGQLYEEFKGEETNLDPYVFVGWEGIILNYADMSMWVDKPVSVDERAHRIISRIQANQTMNVQERQNVIKNMHKALKQSRLLEVIILKLSGVDSAGDLYNLPTPSN